MTTDELLLRRAVGEARGEDCIAWAVETLSAGEDAPALRILAGLSPRHDREEIEPVFLRALRELGLDDDGPPAATPLAAARRVEALFTAGRIRADEAVRLVAAVHRTFDYAEPLLRVWQDIDDELPLLGSGSAGALYPPEALDPLDEAVRTEFELLERAAALDLPPAHLDFIRCAACAHVGPPRRVAQAPSPLPGRRRGPRVVRFTCEACAGRDYRGMSDPGVRADYYARQASGRGTGR